MAELITEVISGVRCYEKDGVAYLNLDDVARGLGFTRIAASGNEVVRWETVRKYLEELGVPTCWHGKEKPTGKDGLPEYIPENIFYRLAMKAKNEVAERFQAKVADEILPTLRRTGGYISNAKMMVNVYFSDVPEEQKTIIEGLLVGIEERQNKINALSDENAAMKPKADFFDAVADSKDAIEMGKVAKVLNYKNIGRNKLFEILRRKKILMDNNIPYQKYVDNGWFRTIEQKYSLPNGETRISIKTLVYQKGVDRIRKILDRR